MLLHIKFLADHGGASGYNLGDLIVIHLTVMIKPHEVTSVREKGLLLNANGSEHGAVSSPDYRVCVINLRCLDFYIYFSFLYASNIFGGIVFYLLFL